MPAEAFPPFYPADSRVSQSVSQAEGKVQTTLDGFGLSISDSSESADRIGLLQRMLQHSSVFLSSKESIPTFRQKVTKSGYSYYQLQESEHRTREKGVLLLPTPMQSDYKRYKTTVADFNRKSPCLPVFAALIRAGYVKLSTPTASQDYKPIRAQIPSEKAGKHGTVLPGSLGRAMPSLIGRAIHPQFVEWMMGLPTGWTNPDCRLSAMQLCLGVSSQSLMQSEESKEVKSE